MWSNLFETLLDYQKRPTNYTFGFQGSFQANSNTFLCLVYIDTS